MPYPTGSSQPVNLQRPCKHHTTCSWTKRRTLGHAAGVARMIRCSTSTLVHSRGGGGSSTSYALPGPARPSPVLFVILQAWGPFFAPHCMHDTTTGATQQTLEKVGLCACACHVLLLALLFLDDQF